MDVELFSLVGDGMNAIRVKNGSIADGRKITVSLTGPCSVTIIGGFQVALASSRSSSRINSQPTASHYCCYCCKNFV